MSTWTDEERAAYRARTRRNDILVGVGLVAVGAVLAYLFTIPMIESEANPTMWGVVLAGGAPGLILIAGLGQLVPGFTKTVRYVADLVGKDRPHDGEGE